MLKIALILSITPKSHVIAAVATLLIHLLLLGFFSIHFGEEQSSALSDADLYNLDMNLEEFISEDLAIKPAGKDPLANQNNSESESISKEKGAIKAPSISSPLENQLKTEESPLIPIDTVIKKIEQVLLLKVDTPKVSSKDTSLLAALTKSTKNSASSKRFTSDRERYEYYKKNYKMIYNFRKVYPYALKTRELIESLNAQLAQMSSDTDKRKLIRETEKKLFLEYESAVRTMSTSQGKLLLKLIARETNKTAFDLIKDYKGGFSASFWFGIGKIFGTDLKSQFNKEREDSLIEDVLIKYQKDDLY